MLDLAEQPVSPSTLAGQTPSRKAGPTLAELGSDTIQQLQSELAVRPIRVPLLVVPVSPMGTPDWDKRGLAARAEVLANGEIVLEWQAEEPATTSLLVLTRESDGYQAAAIEVRSLRRDQGTIQARGTLGGYGDELLQPKNLTPQLDPMALQFALGFPEETLEAWAGVGVLVPVWVERILVCPRCAVLPVFRPGCRQCGCGRLDQDRLLHHFACAHVAPVAAFESPNGLVCPKCRTRDLLVGSDYEYLDGPYRCRECQWSDTELETIGRCVRCATRFPAHQARALDLKGYRVKRLDLLALASPS
jgi:hypothetical protein